MRPVAGGLALPAHTSTKLDPGGIHLMLLDLKGPLVEGTKVKGTLTFEKAGTVDIEFAVGAIGAGAKAVKHDDHGAMPGMKMDP